jgi:hypothetical protein
MHCALLLITTLAICAAAAAQDDLRDRVTMADGKVLGGRVENPHEAAEWTLLQGGKRLRLQRSEVAESDLVADRIREFCERRVRLRDSAKAQAWLVDWAASRQLPGLARAQAMWLALSADDDAAHEFLGHQRGPKGWTWPHEGKRLTLQQLEQALLRSPLTIAGERFAVRCDGDLARATAALLDLEHLGVVWHARFGRDLQLHESLQPILVEVRDSVEDFPKWGFRPIPWYEPPPHGDVARTFCTGIRAPRPERLFFVGTQGLLYRTLIGEVNRQDQRDRVCAWLEIGLGMYMESLMQGDAGFAAPGPLRAQHTQSMTALGRSYRLSQLLHLPMYGAFYLMDDTPTAINWSASTMFVAWLLEPDNQPKTRDNFLRYVRESLGGKKGDSSSLFDEVMGVRIEDLDEPWRQWLSKTAGN